MKKAYIIHGWEGSPEDSMLQWIKKNLEEKDYEVVIPLMPNPDEPELNAWTDKLKEVVNELGSEDIFIGYSIG